MKKSSSKIRYRSMFFRTFTALALLALLMCLVFFGIISRFMYKNVNENMREGYRISAEHYIGNVDREVQNLEQRMIQLDGDSSVISAAVTPGISEKTHNARNIQILSLLRDFVQYNPGASSAILYETAGTEVYTSSDQVCSIESCEEAGLLEKLLTAPADYIHRDRYRNISIRNTEEGIYLCEEFLYSVKQPLSILLVRLDRDYLFRSYAAEPTEHITVYGPDKALIMQTDDALAEEGIRQIADAAGDGLWNGDLYSKDSAYLHWHYLMEFDSGFARLSVSQNLASLSPVLLLLLLIGLVFAYGTSALISRPISSIVESMVQNDASTTERLRNSRNEMEFLANEYQFSSRKETYMQNVLREISTEVVERTLTGLIDGRADEEDAVRILRNTGSGFTADGRYCMILAEEENGHDLAQAEYQAFTSALEETAGSFIRETGGTFAVLPKDGSLIFLAGYSSGASSRSIRNQMNSLYKKMQRMTANWPVLIHLAISFVYTGIDSLPLAFRDTRADIGGMKQQASAQAVSEGIDFEEARGKKIAGLEKEMRAGNIQAAETIFRTLMNEARDDETSETARTLCGGVLKILAAQESLNSIETEPAELHDRCISLLQTGSMAELMQILTSYGEQVLSALDNANRRRQNRYVQKAREYIDENYGDSNLSLSDVAGALDLNKSYLSTLMNEVLDTGFTDYLNSVRIAKARGMLEDTDMTVNEICEQTGFNSVQNFIRVFKKYVGMTPGQYRKQNSST